MYLTSYIRVASNNLILKTEHGYGNDYVLLLQNSGYWNMYSAITFIFALDIPSPSEMQQWNELEIDGWSWNHGMSMN